MGLLGWFQQIRSGRSLPQQGRRERHHPTQHYNRSYATDGHGRGRFALELSQVLHAFRERQANLKAHLSTLLSPTPMTCISLVHNDEIFS
jgi:hypothetical protein